MPGIRFTVPTRYNVSAAAAAMARPGSAETRGSDARGGARVGHRPAPLGDRGRRLAFDVRDSEPAPDRQLIQSKRVDERCERLDGLLEELSDEHLRADVRVDPDQLDRFGRRGAVHRSVGITRRESEPELGVVLAGHDVLVGVRLDAGRDAQQHLRHPSVGDVHPLQAIEFIEAVNDDATDAGVAGHAQLVITLVVAMQDEPVGRDIGGQRHMQLSTTRYVDAHALFVDQPSHGRAEERLGRVSHSVPEGGDRLAAARPEVGLVVDEHRRAIGRSQRVEVAPGDQQLAMRPE